MDTTTPSAAAAAAAAAAGASDVAFVVFDLESLRFVWSQRRTTMSVQTAAGEILSTVHVVDGHERRTVFSGLDDASGAARVRRGGTWLRVGFVNPVTGHVTVGHGHDAEVFVTDPQWRPDAAGVVVERVAGAVFPVLVVDDGTARTMCPRREATFDGFIADLAAYRRGLPHPAMIDMPMWVDQ